MQARTGVLALVSAFGLSATLLAMEPASSQGRIQAPSRDRGALGQYFTPTARDIAPTARQLHQHAQELVTMMVDEARLQRRSGADTEEVRAIMAAGAVAGQAQALRLMAERGVSDANVREAASHLNQLVTAAEDAILDARTNRRVRDAWNEVARSSIRLNRMIARNDAIEDRGTRRGTRVRIGDVLEQLFRDRDR